MELRRITFKTSILAKKLGFDLNVENFYGKHRDEVFEVDNSDGVYVTGSDYKLLGRKSYESNEVIKRDYNKDDIQNDYDVFCPLKYSAPSQALLQQWLRLVYDINVLVEGNEKGHLVWTIYHNENGYPSPMRAFYNFSYENWSYENALELGLYNALGIIKT